MKTLMIDFDGVLASYDGSYRSGVLGEPYPGALAAVESYVRSGFDVVVHTARARDKAGHASVRNWLALNGFDGLVCPSHIRVTAFKEPAVAYLDDRAMTFKGEWPSPEELNRFLPYWEQVK